MSVYLLRVSSAHSMKILLIDRRDYTGTSQPTLGALFFPLSPPSRKGATHTIQWLRLAPSLPCKAELPLLPRWVSQLPTSKSIKSIFLQCNDTKTQAPLFFLLLPFFYRVSNLLSFLKSHLIKVLKINFLKIPFRTSVPHPLHSSIN